MTQRPITLLSEAVQQVENLVDQISERLTQIVGMIEAIDASTGTPDAKRKQRRKKPPKR